MWTKYLRQNYASFAEWKSYSDTYGLAGRLCYSSPEPAWRDNPLIQGSTDPKNYSLVPMTKKFWLPHGTTGFFDGDKFVCTGSQMGRPNMILVEKTAEIKLRLTRLPFVDHCYDRWGAYWGSPANIWCAWFDGTRIFVRANTRDLAKAAIRLKRPNVTFYR